MTNEKNDLFLIDEPIPPLKERRGGIANLIVTERMFFSHRKEINFPVPRLLITHAQKNTPWLIYPKN